MDACADPVFDIVLPKPQRAAAVFASPHSGRDYPPDFLAQSALDAETLRRSEDSYVDELFDTAPEHGAPLLRALFPRAYLDVNRGPYELDPAMFDAPLPPYVNSKSPRVAAGLGTIARLVGTGAEIYKIKLSFAEVEERINRLYHPYHAALSDLVDSTVERFGCCLLIDCHSMPSAGGEDDLTGFDVVLGDCYGAACAPSVVTTTESFLRHKGYAVARNTPYAGGFTTRHYGRPAAGRHVLQIEVNRRLYMDETTHQKLPAFDRVRADIEELIVILTRLATTELRP